ncbi:MAG TPA: exosortase/archaeosortase family protein, partial [Opitutaceae bacterium]|nr:exosortase/archaeosortase family protein [Opitutaceae bacterium]
MTSVGTRGKNIFWVGALCAVCGFLIFQFLGNSTHGYIASSSLFYWWGFQWVNAASETEHGFPILAISAWLVYHNLRREQPAAASYGPASAAMVAGLLVHALGFVAEQARLSILGLLLFTWGAVSVAGGRRWSRAVAFPIAFMVFAIPINALDSAGFWLRMWVIGTSSAVVHGLGIHVLVNGTQLLSQDGRYDYDVAAACSGIRSLVAVTALSLLIGYLMFRNRWLWAAMFAVAFPLIYVANVVRIVSIVVAAQLGGQSLGDKVHEVMGFVVFVMVLGGVYFVAEWAARAKPGWAREEPRGKAASSEPITAQGPALRLCAAAVVVTSVLVACLLVHVSAMASSGKSGIALEADGMNPVALPTFVGEDWIGRRTEISAVEREVLPPDTGYSRKTYVSLADPTKQVFLSIVLSGRDRTSIHRPEVCLVGQGWTIGGSFQHSFAFPGKTSRFPATVLRVEKEVLTP